MEFEFTGDRCALPHCRQHDYLPFKCTHCRRPYCLEHRTPAAHLCDQVPQEITTTVPCSRCGAVIAHLPVNAPAQLRTAAIARHSRVCANRALSPRCPVPNCREKLVVPYRCTSCNIAHCLKHRIPSDHSCKASASASTSASPLGGLQLALRQFQRFSPSVRATAEAQNQSQPKGFVNSPTDPLGDAKVEGAQRLYCEVFFEGNLLDQHRPRYMFFNRNWLIGRTIDAIAKEVNISSVNDGGRLQLSVGKPHAQPAAMLDRISEAIPQHSRIFVAYERPANARSCAVEKVVSDAAKQSEMVR